MTKHGEAFVSRMRVVAQMAKAGTPVFAALAAGLEDEDWVLIYAAACRMALDIENQDDKAA
jgi:hypothetical protein